MRGGSQPFSEYRNAHKKAGPKAIFSVYFPCGLSKTLGVAKLRPLPDSSRALEQKASPHLGRFLGLRGATEHGSALSLLGTLGKAPGRSEPTDLLGDFGHALESPDVTRALLDRLPVGGFQRQGSLMEVRPIRSPGIEQKGALHQGESSPR